ncbi:uncharacterized protein LOC121639906 [Melanotaenia boesemani]|uniref:uncharacterized protein LOC121639906 n=1 Tax=Melanotaenia boesemani TaxID=1250792 RepID=UPI001C054D03|nr:uncharacterized protein LOC121639906 [Melanotaenia boesemani]
MRRFILIALLFLCSFSWICESQTVEVQQGEDATLLCSNISTSPTQTDWFRVVNRTKPSCISAMYGAEGEASFCDGLKDGKFEMSSNMSTVFLRIKQVDFSDSGLYFCGFYVKRHTVIVGAAELIVQGKGRHTDVTYIENGTHVEVHQAIVTVILSSLIVFFMVAVTALVLTIKKCQTDAEEEQNPDRNEDPTDLMFLTETIRRRRPAEERALETHVIYTART